MIFFFYNTKTKKISLENIIEETIILKSAGPQVIKIWGACRLKDKARA